MHRVEVADDGVRELEPLPDQSTHVSKKIPSFPIETHGAEGGSGRDTYTVEVGKGCSRRMSGLYLFVAQR